MVSSVQAGSSGAPGLWSTEQAEGEQEAAAAAAAEAVASSDLSGRSQTI